MAGFGFIISDQVIPTYWTQNPEKSALLTGWLGGPEAAVLKDAADDHILALTIQSLGKIFDMQEADIRNLLSGAEVMNWTADPYSRGSYSYATVHTAEARKVLTAPINGAIYFAGEGLYDGPEMGTVEAALASGKKIAEIILG